MLFSKIVRDAKAKEFANLVQGTMIMHQYAARFVEPLWFAMYLIPDKERKAWKFEKGLNPRTYKQVVIF